MMQVYTDGIKVYAVDEPESGPVDWGALVASICADNIRPLQYSPKIDAHVLAAIELKEMVAKREQYPRPLPGGGLLFTLYLCAARQGSC